jgi:hypothetical protein
MNSTKYLKNGMRGKLNSYLIEITRDILAFKDGKEIRLSKKFSIRPVRREPENGQLMRH